MSCRNIQWLVLACCLVTFSSGCGVLSQAAYSLGTFLDPKQQACVNHIGGCTLCGQPPPGAVGSNASTGPGGVVQAGYQCPQCGHHGLPAGPPPEFAAQLEQMRADTTACREQLATIDGELRNRGQMLVQTRAELARVQNDVMMLRTNVSQWQTSMQQLHTQIRERDDQRNAMVNAMMMEVQKVVSAGE